MPFQVKATVVGFLGNSDVYPCHMMHRVGDQVVFDGESYSGRLCPDVWPLIAPKVAALHQAGPRYVEWASCYPFWYCSPSDNDPGQKPYDGLGFKNVLKSVVPPRYDMATLAPPGAFTWPAHTERNIAREPTVICPDTRTSMLVRLEAFDLSERGFDTPFFRRQMAIMAKLLSNKAVEAEGVADLFSQREKEEIYPSLGPVALQILIEELEVMAYVVTVDGMLLLSDKGKKKLERFKADLPDRDRRLFQKYEGQD